VIFKLIELYVKTKQYKNAMKLMTKQLKTATNPEIKKDLKSQLTDIETLYKNTNGLLKFLGWKIFKI